MLLGRAPGSARRDLKRPRCVLLARLGQAAAAALLGGRKAVIAFQSPPTMPIRAQSSTCYHAFCGGVRRAGLYWSIAASVAARPTCSWALDPRPWLGRATLEGKLMQPDGLLPLSIPMIWRSAAAAIVSVASVRGQSVDAGESVSAPPSRQCGCVRENGWRSNCRANIRGQRRDAGPIPNRAHQTYDGGDGSRFQAANCSIKRKTRPPGRAVAPDIARSSRFLGHRPLWPRTFTGRVWRLEWGDSWLRLA